MGDRIGKRKSRGSTGNALVNYPRLPIVYQDDSLLVVDKPGGMLSVPGREAQQLKLPGGGTSRQEQWTAAVQAAGKRLPQPVCDEALAAALKMIGGRNDLNIPRKRELFVKYVHRVLKLGQNDEGSRGSIGEACWDVVKEVDSDMHRLGFDDIPGHLKSAADIAAEVAGGPIFHVHRLDMETSGLLVFAKTEQACAHLSRQFHDHTVRKTYLAMVKASVTPELSGTTISLPLRPDLDNRPRQVVDAVGGKPCETVLTVVRRVGSEATLVELQPLTGRTHQLRVHMAALGHPILGDSLYNPDCAAAAEAGAMGGSSLCLHAWRIAFTHPASNLALTLATERHPFEAREEVEKE